MSRRRTAFAALLAVCVLLFSTVHVAHGRPVNWGTWTPDMLKLLCDTKGGIYGPPSAGGVYFCLLPDGTLYVCDSTGACTKDAAKASSSGGSIKDQLDLLDDKTDLIILKLDRLATQLTAIQDFLVSGVPPMPDLTAVPIPSQPGPAGFCRRDNQGQLHVQTTNQGGADAGETVTRVVFACGNAQLCSGPIQVDAATPALLKLGGIAEQVFTIPGGCFSASTNQCNFEIRVDAGNTVVENDETNNNKAGVCGPQIQ